MAASAPRWLSNAVPPLRSIRAIGRDILASERPEFPFPGPTGEAHPDGANIAYLVELFPELKHPGQLIAAATAFRHREPGCIVLDGPRSRWYPAMEMPEETSAMSVLMIHIGRALIGFTDEPDRRKFLKPDTTAESATELDEDE